MHLRGKYEILDKIGSGGMASVYKARHLAFNEIRAIKVVSSRFMDDDSFLKRFKNEAIITRKLQHPNAVRVDDLDMTDDGRPFMILEYVEGRDLREVIQKEGPLAFERAWAIGKQVVSALGAAHELGITHRDIKPDNILLVKQPDGSELVKILDFGIAKIREGAFDSGSSYSATKTGVVVGTPQYLSPEQAMGKHGSDVDGRADIYSVGVVLYEMLTGRLPFESDTPVGMLIKHIQSMPMPAHEFRPDLNIPKPVSMVLMKAMQKDRNDRFQTAAEMMEAMKTPEQWAATARIGTQAATARDDATAAIGSDVLANLRLAPSRVPTPAPSNRPAAPPVPAPPPLRPAPPTEPVRATVPPPAPPPAPLRYTPPPAPPAVASVAPTSEVRPEAPAARPAARPARVPPPPQKSATWLWVVVAVLLTAGIVGGAGFWYMRQQQAAAAVQTPVPVPNHAEQDTRIKGSVAGVLAAHDFQKLRVGVEDGVVTLSGDVQTSAQAEEAVRLAGLQDGVKQVRNQISFPPIAPVAVPVSTQAPTATEEAGAAKEKPSPKPKTAAAREPPAPRGPTPQQRRHLQELLSDGERLTNSGAYAAAIEAYNSALEIDPKNSAAGAGLARARQAKETEEEILRRRK